IPVVMVSGVDELQSVVRCIERGADDYLAKPFNATLLKARIEACLAKKRLWDELGEKFRQLQELEGLRDSLTHMIVHDLRTPLTSILTGLQTMQLGGPFEAHQQEFLTMAISGGSVLLGMINDLLDVNKMEAGFLELEHEEIEPARLVEQSMAQVIGIAKDKEIDLVVEVAPNLPAIWCDENKLTRTLVNLLGNAVKFTGRGGSVTLSVQLDDDGESFLFAVRDTGEGIPEEAFTRVFEKFGQVQNGNSNPKMSTGLGLTFCKMAVEAHGGRIWVRSELGKGSVFSFTIPKRKE
ncbi:MAG: ATP-binding protein, partial [Armatimonadota bacterium]|nr:ATP-binding protein [Armatimonadota bacterium]